METDEWRVTSEIDHLVDFLQELTVILERVPPSPVLEDALKQTLCTVTLFKNYFKYTKANIASGGELAGETQATIDPFGDADGDKAYLPVLRLSRIQHSWMRGFYEKEYASEGAGLDKATMIDDMLEQLLRALRVGRVLKLLKSMKDLRVMFGTLVVVLPSITSVTSFLFLLTLV